MSKGQTYAIHSTDIMVGVGFAILAYLLAGQPAMFIISGVGRALNDVTHMYFDAKDAGYSLLAIGIGVAGVGLLIWKFSETIEWMLKGSFIGLMIRGVVQLVRQLLGYGPDPYTHGWLYHIRPVIEYTTHQALAGLHTAPAVLGDLVSHLPEVYP